MQDIDLSFMETSMCSEESELLMVVDQATGEEQGHIQVMYVRRPGSGRRKSKPFKAPWHHSVCMSEPEEWLEEVPVASSQPALKKRRLEVHGPCCHCGAVSSPQWRKGPKGKPVLCNACGIRFLRTRSLGKVPPPPSKRVPGHLRTPIKPSGLILPRQESISSACDLDLSESPNLSALDSPAGIEMPPECSLEPASMLTVASSLESELILDGCCQLSHGSDL